MAFAGDIAFAGGMGFCRCMAFAGGIAVFVMASVLVDRRAMAAINFKFSLYLSI